MEHHEQLANMVIKALPVLKSVLEADAAIKPAPEKWSKKEVLGHLVDSAYHNHQRFLIAGLQENLIFNGYDQVAWVVKNRYQSRGWEEIIGTWMMANNHLVKLLEGIPESQLLATTTVHNFDRICMRRLPPKAMTSLSYLVEDYLFHIEHHLVQINPAYERIIP